MFRLLRFLKGKEHSMVALANASGLKGLRNTTKNKCSTTTANVLVDNITYASNVIGNLNFVGKWLLCYIC
jgi:hypothetical protein